MKAIVYMVLAGLLIGFALEYRTHVYQQGVDFERVRRDGIDAEKTRVAKLETARLNGAVAGTQAALEMTLIELDRIKLELKNEKILSASRQSDLSAGRVRERVLVRTVSANRTAAANGQAQGSAAGDLDPGSGVEVDLDPRVASWLEGVRADHNAAVKRLGACVASYDAVKAAADAMP